MKKFILVFGVFVIVLNLKGQSDINDTTLSIPMFYASYSYYWPGGDLADRFGPNSAIAAGFQWKTQSNWLLGTEFNFIFGDNIKMDDDFLSNLLNDNGTITDLGGNPASYAIFERGFFITGKVGKVIPVFSPNPNSGFVVSANVGYFQHKIRFDIQDNNVPQLQGDYKKGYDRFTSGFSIGQFIGYQYLSNRRILNFYGGFEFNQAWTNPQRDVNFDTMEPDPVQNRFDLLSGFRIGWIIPIFERLPERNYYY